MATSELVKWMALSHREKVQVTSQWDVQAREGRAIVDGLADVLAEALAPLKVEAVAIPPFWRLSVRTPFIYDLTTIPVTERAPVETFHGIALYLWVPRAEVWPALLRCREPLAFEGVFREAVQNNIALVRTRLGLARVSPADAYRRMTAVARWFVHDR